MTAQKLKLSFKKIHSRINEILEHNYLSSDLKKELFLLFAQIENFWIREDTLSNQILMDKFFQKEPDENIKVQSDANEAPKELYKIVYPPTLKKEKIVFSGSVILHKRNALELAPGEELSRTLYFYFLQSGSVMFETSGHCDEYLDDVIKIKGTSTHLKGIYKIWDFAERYGRLRKKRMANRADEKKAA